ncbi:MAG: ABC transporter permease [Acidobacteriota bacterium]
MPVLRFFRTFWRERAFCIPAIITIAVGIGATTAVASFAYAVLLRPFPYPESHRLVRLFTVLTEEQGAGRNMSLLDIRDVNERATLSSNFGAYNDYDSLLQGPDGAQVVSVSELNLQVLRALGIAPALGRLFAAEAELSGGPVREAILSHSLWKSRFGGDPNVLGQNIVLRRASYEVVGVMPADFSFPDRTQLWLTMESWYELPLDGSPQQREQRAFPTLGRLAPGATLAQAQAEIDRIAAGLQREHPETNRGVEVNLVPLRDAEVGPVRPYVRVLAAGVTLLLLICLGNVVNLFLVRALARRPQYAVQSALGARRLDLARGPFADSVVLCLVGGAIGALLAGLAVGALDRMLPETLPAWLSLQVDPVVLAFCFGLTLFVGLVLGIAPALMGSRVDLVATLGSGSRAAGGSSSRGRAALIVVEVALSFVLLVGAGLLMASFARLQQTDQGFEPNDLHVVRAMNSQVASGSREEIAAFYAAHHQRILDRLAALPGVTSTASTDRVPYVGFKVRNGRLRVRGSTDQELRFMRPIASADVSSGYFKTMGVPLLRGRAFQSIDTADSAPVVVINEVAADVLFGDREAVGQMLHFGNTVTPTNPYCRVVGVVGDVRHGAVESGTLELYFPSSQWPNAGSYYVLRTEGNPAGFDAAVRNAIREVDPGTAVVWQKSMNDRIDETLWQRRLWSSLFALFAGSAVLLAIVGLYGLLSYSIVGRRSEIGVRLALGARPTEIGSMVVTDGLKLVTAGLALGAFGAFAVTRFIAATLDGVGELGWALYVATTLMLFAAAAAACAWPALRASRTDPAVVLDGQ